MFKKLHQKINELKHHRHVQMAPVFGGLALLVVVLFISVAAVLVPQEIRQQANSLDRNVELVFVPSTTPLRADTLSTLFVRVNTHGQEIDGLQVVFELRDEDLEGVSVKVKEPPGLRRVWDRVEGIPGGKRVSFALVTTSPNSPFANGSPVDVAEVIFTIKEPGDMDVVFDDSWTKANAHKQVQNVLKQYVAYQYEVSVAPSPSPTVKPSPVTTTATSQRTTSGTQGTGTTGSATGSQQAKGTGNTTGTTSKTTTNDDLVASVVIDSQPSQGGVSTTPSSATTPSTGAACNRECSFSADCDTGYLCYRKQCRRIGNVTSETCGGEIGVGGSAADQQDADEAEADTPLADASTALNCDAACNQTSDCSVGLFCYQNQCRNPNNPESVSCAQAVVSDEDAINTLCGEVCSTNSECGDSLSCYRGECRLETNPTSDTCVAGNIGNTQYQEDDQVVTSPSPSPIAEDLVETPTVRQPSIFSRILRWFFYLGAVAGLAIAGFMGYLWYKDRQTSGL